MLSSDGPHHTQALTATVVTCIRSSQLKTQHRQHKGPQHPTLSQGAGGSWWLLAAGKGKLLYGGCGPWSAATGGWPHPYATSGPHQWDSVDDNSNFWRTWSWEGDVRGEQRGGWTEFWVEIIKIHCVRAWKCQRTNFKKKNIIMFKKQVIKAHLYRKPYHTFQACRREGGFSHSCLPLCTWRVCQEYVPLLSVGERSSQRRQQETYFP